MDRFGAEHPSVVSVRRANFLSGKGVMRACSAAHWEEYFVVCESVWASWGGRRRLGRQPRTDRRPAITTKKWSCVGAAGSVAETSPKVWRFVGDFVQEWGFSDRH